MAGVDSTMRNNYRYKSNIQIQYLKAERQHDYVQSKGWPSNWLNKKKPLYKQLQH